MPLAVEEQNPNHWTDREVPQSSLFWTLGLEFALRVAAE